MGKEIGWKYIVGTMQTSGKMLAILQSREFEFNKKRSTVCRTAFSFEIKRRFLLPKPSRRIDSPVGHVGMENCAKAFSFSSGLYLCRYVCLCPPFSLSHFSFTLSVRRLARLFTLLFSPISFSSSYISSSLSPPCSLFAF